MIFFSSCCSEGAKLISADGHSIPDLLSGILKLFPLDTYVFNPVSLMDLVNSDKQKNLEVIQFNKL
jgi:L-fucose mutarotase